MTMVVNNGHILVLFLGSMCNYGQHKAFCFIKIIPFSLMNRAMQYNTSLEEHSGNYFRKDSAIKFISCTAHSEK